MILWIKISKYFIIMVNLEELEKKIKEEIYKLRNLGEHARRGSDHLYYRSISKIKIGRLKEVKFQEKLIYEVDCKYDVYTETEFLHPPEMDDLYTEHYNDKFIFDKDFTLLEIKDNRQKK